MLNECQIAELEKMGFKRWTKGNMDRLYASAAVLGLSCEYYTSGNVKRAALGDVSVSNCEARHMKASKTYIDINTGAVVSDNKMLEEAAAALLGGIA